VSYVLYFAAAILLVLTYDLGSTDKTMNYSRFYVTWVVGLEVQITISMSRFIWMAEGSEFESWRRQEFSLLHVVQIGSGAHLTSYPMGTGGKAAEA
jgi:hypothetical protein